jgi:hypothetical protein
MPEYKVIFRNRNSGWVHTDLNVSAADEKAADVAARAAFNKVHAFENAWTDPEDGTYHPTKGTPGYDASLYDTSVALIDPISSDAVAQALEELYPTASVGGVQQDSVPGIAEA